jgi:ribonuclease P protein component
MARDLSFPKARRLTQAAEFQRVREEGRRIRGSLISLGICSSGEGKMRAGFVTSRKVGGAVARNRVRRQLREIVRRHQHEIIDGTWVVLIASPRAANATYEALDAEWLRLVSRASILAP